MRDAVEGFLTGAFDSLAVVALGCLALVLVLALINALAGLAGMVGP